MVLKEMIPKEIVLKEIVLKEMILKETHQNAITVDDRVQPMCDRDHGAVGEDTPDCLLDQLVGVKVH